MHSSDFRQPWRLGVPAVLLAGISGTAIAAAPAEAPEAPALEEIVVTAQKREEKLQETPISITAITADELTTRGIDTIADLGSTAPNLFTRMSPSSNGIMVIGIRGSVQGQPAIWADPPVGVYLDGAYLGKSQGGVLDVVDLERVEVLRGPQGTLFGRNTEGGAINFVSRKPSGEFRGSAGVEVGNFNHQIYRIGMDLPRLGILSVGLNGRKETMDGWARNLTGEDMGALDREAYRVAATLDFTDDLQLTYSYDYSETNNTPPPVSLYALSGWKVGMPPAGSQGTFPTTFGAVLGGAIENAMRPYVTTRRPDTVSTPAGLDLYDRSKNTAHMARLNWNITDTEEIRYIFATRDMSYRDQTSLTGTPLTSICYFPVPGGCAPGRTWGMAAHFDRNTDYTQTSHELQWLGNHDRLHYVLGLYYFTDEGTSHGFQNFSLLAQAPRSGKLGADTEAKAAFAQMDWEFVDNWTGTVGIRYTEEEREGFTHGYLTSGYHGAFLTDDPAACAALRQSCLPMTTYREDWTGTTPMASLSYKFSDDLNFYARVARGFKSGGFSSELINPAVTTPYDPEYSMSYELGAKSTLWDGRVTLNGTVFYTVITERQSTMLVPGTTQSIMQNAGEMTNQGIEIEARALVADGWTVYLNYGYLDSTFEEFIDNKLNPPNVNSLIDTASNRLPGYAPENTLSAGFDGRLMQTDEGDLRLIVDYNFVDDYYLYAVNKDLAAPNAGGPYWKETNGIPASTQVNARLLFADIPLGGGTMDVSLFVKNLLDSDKLVQGIDFSMFRNANWQEPRTAMVTFAYKW